VKLKVEGVWIDGEEVGAAAWRWSAGSPRGWCPL